MTSITTTAIDNNNSSSSDNFDNIWVAATNGDIDSVQNFLSQGVDVNVQDEETGNSPIHSAVSYGQVKLLEFLIRNGANVNLRDSDGDTPILLCEDQACFELLEANGADLLAKNNENLGWNEKAIELAEEGNNNMVSYLFNRELIPINFVLEQNIISSTDGAIAEVSTPRQGGNNEIIDINNDNNNQVGNSPSEA